MKWLQYIKEGYKSVIKHTKTEGIAAGLSNLLEVFNKLYFNDSF